jgi:D-alanyl-D-alanine carboxypeptidase
VVVNNTNSPLLGTFDSAILGKTGLTNRAGWCVAMVLEEQGQRYSIIVLGAATKAQRTKMVEQAVYSKIR